MHARVLLVVVLDLHDRQKQLMSNGNAGPNKTRFGENVERKIGASTRANHKIGVVLLVTGIVIQSAFGAD